MRELGELSLPRDLAKARQVRRTGKPAHIWPGFGQNDFRQAPFTAGNGQSGTNAAKLLRAARSVSPTHSSRFIVRMAANTCAIVGALLAAFADRAPLSTDL